jgi:cytochrome b pre-mRNA-processing protein 3
MMVMRLFRRNPVEGAAKALYREIVTAARTPALYRDLSVPDTIDGRFDMITLVATLVFRRLSSLDAAGRALSQACFDLMFADMERNLGELGVGDSVIGRKVQTMAQAFYGRAKAYDPVLSAGDREGLGAALVRNVYRGIEPDPDRLSGFIDFVLAVDRHLASMPAGDLLAGRLGLGDDGTPMLIAGAGA